VKRFLQRLLLLLFITCIHLPIASADNISPFAKMMRAMIDAFREADKGDEDWDDDISFGYSDQAMPLIGPYGAPMAGAYPNQFWQQGRQIISPRQAQQYKLSQTWDGIWKSSTGSLLYIKQGYARLYFSKDVFQDFQIRIKKQHLLLKEKQGGKINSYRYKLDNGRLVLTDKSNNLLLFKKIQ